MAKDLIGNVLHVGDKVHVQLVNPQIFGFIAEVVEPPMIARSNRAELRPGHVLVSCVIAIPIDPTLEGIPQIARVYDSAKEESREALDRVVQPN
jgi:hypothetical protein